MPETPRIPLPRLPLGLPKPPLPALAALGLGALPPLWREVRVALEAAALMREPIFHGEGVSDGGGQPVLLVPGFLAGDDAFALMTDWLRRTGHVPSRSGMRLNVDCSGASIKRLERQLEQLVEREGRRAAIIGHSRGGHLAKVLAVKRPELVSGVVALGSPLLDPFAIHPLVRLQIELVGALGSLGVPGLFGRACLDGDCCLEFWQRSLGRLPGDIGYVSVYSRSDGVVDWRACLDPHASHAEVDASHIGMSLSAQVYRTVAEALADFRRRTTPAAPAPAG
ncbi:MAG: esterase/lipase family protein [Nocardioidaceae bacterium]